jgi:tRNA (mo5U34)-methyltransferase
MPSELEDSLAACPEWFHSIELAPGVVTPGRCPASHLDGKWRLLDLGDLRGRTVLDIGAYDGYFSFRAEQAGAERVVALDHYVWSADMAAYMIDWRASKDAGGARLPAPHASKYWDPVGLPGKRPFDLAHRARRSRVEATVADFATMDLEPLGRFDVVLFLGTLYHLTDPLGALERVARLTAPGGVAIIETQAAEVAGVTTPIWECFPGQELNNDASNWWAPNLAALAGCCRAVGFSRITRLTELPYVGRKARILAAWRRQPTTVSQYRLIVRAER